MVATVNFFGGNRRRPPRAVRKFGAYEPGQRPTVAELMGDRLDRVRQELHVIDLRSFLCVTLVSPTVPDAVAITDVNWAHTPQYLQDGDAVFFTNSSCNSMSGLVNVELVAC